MFGFLSELSPGPEVAPGPGGEVAVAALQPQLVPGPHRPGGANGGPGGAAAGAGGHHNHHPPTAASGLGENKHPWLATIRWAAIFSCLVGQFMCFFSVLFCPHFFGQWH